MIHVIRFNGTTMATNHSHELAPSRYPINREISDRRNRERKNLTGNANWSLVVCDGILQAGCLVFYLHGPKTSSIERSGSWLQEKTKRLSYKRGGKGENGEERRNPLKRKGVRRRRRRRRGGGRKHPADTQEGGGWIEKARARQRDGGKKGTMRRKIGTYIETDRGRKEKGLEAGKGGVSHCRIAPSPTRFHLYRFAILRVFCAVALG